ncbi:MAG TPA: FAD-dependent oxidoreductase [Dongiaceae bacterium]|jgi:2,4-dienoyl-CoA reductase-like NADH-dependent reductase (Old Yellow Enzyme family)/thioredoxin reductase|nr:FAD-dependent oxidoreductase [Dongiaceae bacterium]
MSQFPRLFSPLTLRGHEIRNRILSTGHQTYLSENGLPSAGFIAYHEARARGGAGLIVTEAARFHETGFTDSPEIVVTTDDCIPAFRRLAEAIHRHGAKVFGQLSHSGRCTRRMKNGMRGVAYAPSAIPDNRFHTMPREMPVELIQEIVEAAGAAAARYANAGLDGIEVLASHGLLFSQFLNPRTNIRIDHYGGSRENRLRALLDVLRMIRKRIGEGMVLGIRISVEEVESDGLDEAEVIAICQALKNAGAIDYVNTTIGSMAGLGGSIHVVPPMEIAHAYVAPQAGSLRAAVGLPVFVAGRINQPQIAEAVLVAGQADMCGMTRAMISDPEIANKAKAGRLDDIRACIGCNQACIGHYHAGYSISCIQNPVTGREVAFGRLPRAVEAKRVLVAGGGPAGMKAAAVAAERGHKVILCEAAPHLGGQALLAQMLPERAEFGGIITNLERELTHAGVEIRLKTALDAKQVKQIAPDTVILATGAKPYLPAIEGEEAHLVDAWSVLKSQANPGSRVVIADWRCDWVGMGLAEKLAKDGHHVRLAVNGTHAGQNLQMYLRDHWAAKLHKLGVEVIPYARLFGADRDSAYFSHIVSGEPIVMSDVDTVVLALGHAPETALEIELAPLNIPLHLAGDCLSPRSAEEAVYEGMLAGRAV